MDHLCTAVAVNVLALPGFQLPDQIARISGVKIGLSDLRSWASGDDIDLPVPVIVVGGTDFLDHIVIGFPADDQGVYGVRELGVAIVFTFFFDEFQKTQVVVGFCDVAVYTCCNEMDSLRMGRHLNYPKLYKNGAGNAYRIKIY